ncbi:MAG: CD1247 N-terminal domain-containing protein [Christensenellales bacterium]
MEKLTDKVAFLLGLAEGMNLNPQTPENKLLLKILDVLKDFSYELEEMRDRQDDLSEYVDNIDEDLSEVEELLFDDEDEDEDEEEDEESSCRGCGHHHHHEEAAEGEMEYECPHCGYQTKFDLADFDFEEDYLCPQCHKSFFPEGETEDEDDEQDDEDKAGKDE